MLTIGLSGLPRVGKTTAADYMARYSYTLESFASPLKVAAKMIYPQIGDDFTNSNKDTLNEELGMTPRYILQKLGTEVGREIHPDTWIMNMRNRIKYNEDLSYGTVIDDVRFPNELAICDYIIHINRAGCEPKYIQVDGVDVIHPSDSNAELFKKKADVVILNNGTLKKYFENIDLAVGLIEEENSLNQEA